VKSVWHACEHPTRPVACILPSEMPVASSPGTDDSSKAPRFILGSLLLAEAAWGFLVTWVFSKTHQWYGWDLSGTHLGRLMFAAALGGSGYLCGNLHPKHSWLFGPASALLPIGIMAAHLVRDIDQEPTSHNLWPFEVAFYPLLAVPAWAGASVGARVARRRENRPSPRA
jgi:hypothetical protein